VIRIGLTGGIATGKTLVAAYLKEAGLPVVSADRVGHRLLETNSEVRARLRDRYGAQTFTPSGHVDRARLARSLFGSPRERTFIERLLHPLIRKKVDRMAREAEARRERFFVVEAALMLEASWTQDFDCLVVVTCSQRLQLERLMARDGLGRDQALARTSAQMPLVEKEKAADLVVFNNGSKEELRAETSLLIARVADLFPAGAAGSGGEANGYETRNGDGGAHEQ